jgi:hypothetical protein
MFPMVILLENDKKPTYITDQQSLPIGRNFKILLTEANSENFRLASKICAVLLK